MFESKVWRLLRGVCGKKPSALRAAQHIASSCIASIGEINNAGLQKRSRRTERACRRIASRLLRFPLFADQNWIFHVVVTEDAIVPHTLAPHTHTHTLRPHETAVIIFSPRLLHHFPLFAAESGRTCGVRFPWLAFHKRSARQPYGMAIYAGKTIPFIEREQKKNASRHVHLLWMHPAAPRVYLAGPLRAAGIFIKCKQKSERLLCWVCEF